MSTLLTQLDLVLKKHKIDSIVLAGDLNPGTDIDDLFLTASSREAYRMPCRPSRHVRPIGTLM